MKKKLTALVAAFLLAMSVCACSASGGQSVTKETVAAAPTEIVTSTTGSAVFGAIPAHYHNLYRWKESGSEIETATHALILESSIEDTAFEFSTRFDKNRLSKNVNLVDFVILSDEIETSQDTAPNSSFSEMEIRLTQVSDPSNYIRTVITTRTDVNFVCNGRAGSATQRAEGRLHTTQEFNSLVGTQLQISFTGAVRGGTHYAGAVSYDESEKAVYAYPSTNTGRKVVVRDLDEPLMMLTDSPWSGFTDSELRLSIRLKSINSTARVAVLAVGGVPINSDPIADEVGPDIYPIGLPDGELKAQVNKRVPVPQFQAYDNLYGITDEVETKVFKNYGETNASEYLIDNGAFTPDTIGTYTVVATARDDGGNVSVHTSPITVVGRLQPLYLELNSPIPSGASVGERVSLPAATTMGGTLARRYDITVIKGEETYPVENNAVLLPEQGVYTVRYTVRDYLDDPVNFDYFIRAIVNPEPIVEFPFLPSVVPNGYTVRIPEFSAQDWYSFAAPVNAIIEYTLTLPSGSSRTLDSASFVPMTEGEHTLKITAASATDSDKSVSKEYTITVVPSEKVVDYFTLDNVEITEVGGSSVFHHEGTEGSFSFINPLPADNFRLRYRVPSGYDGYSAVALTLTDSLDPTRQVTLTMRSTGTYTGAISFCGETYEVNSSFDYSCPFLITFNGTSFSNLINTLGAVTSFDDGREFGGFPSGFAYMTITMSGSAPSSALQIMELCNHTDFRTNAVDNSAPMVRTSGSYSATASVGSVVRLPEYSAFDVFDGALDVAVTVSKDGSEIARTSGERLSFTVTDYGVYAIRATATDTKGNIIGITANIYCDNLTPLEIKLLGAVPKTGKVNQRLTLPSATATGISGNEIAVGIYVKVPSGAFVVVTDGAFVPTSKGTHTVYYYAHDPGANATFNYALVKSTFTVA